MRVSRIRESGGRAINGRPRGVLATHRAFAVCGIQSRSRALRDGWRATLALPREDLQMPHKAVNHARGVIVAGDTDAPFPEEMRFCPTNHVGGKWSAIERWVGGGGGCGSELPCVGEWGPYFRGFQWRKWIAGSYAPPLVDDVAALGRAIREDILEADAAEAREFRDSNVIGLLDSEDELRERPPMCACVV